MVLSWRALQLAAAAVVAVSTKALWGMLRQRQRQRRLGYRIIHVPLPPSCNPESTVHGHTSLLCQHGHMLGAAGQPAAEQEHLTVYLLQEDEATCGRALNNLLPDLLQWQVKNPHRFATSSSTRQPEAATAAVPGIPVDHGGLQDTGTEQMTEAAASQQQQQRQQQRQQQHQQKDQMAITQVSGTEVQLVLGIDAEWPPEELPGQHNKISVLQVAGPSWVIILRPQSFQSASIPVPLAQLMADPQVAKVGVGIQEDVRRMAADFGVNVRGAVDIRAVAQLVCPDIVAAVGGSLSALTQAVVGRLLDKQQQRSAWGSAKLTQAQITYAAQDAWASRVVLLAMCNLAARDAPWGDDQQGRGHLQPNKIECMPLAADRQGQQASCPSKVVARFLAPFLDNFKRKQVQQAINKAAAAGGKAWLFHFPGMVGTGQGLTARGVQAMLQPTFSSSSGISGLDSYQGTTGSRAWKKPPRHALRKSKLYENCRLQAPDGQVLCTCSLKKVHWYVDRGLGSIVCEDPVTVRLHFAPRGRGHQDDNYYTSDKVNQCVVCGATTASLPEQQQALSRSDSRCSGSSCVGSSGLGAPLAQDSAATQPPASTCPANPMPGSNASMAMQPEHSKSAMSRQAGKEAGNVKEAGNINSERDEVACDEAKTESAAGEALSGSESYLRHSVVPPSYRRCFPVSFKSHLSHDIVLLCLQCAQVCSVHDQKRMAWLGEMYGAPLSLDKTKFKYDEGVAAVRSAARALLNPKVSLPSERKAQLQAIVAARYGMPSQEPDDSQLQQAAMLDPRKPTSEWFSHAARVVSCLRTAEDIEAFVRGWRQHFLDTMQPRFLPPHWSVDARVANSSLAEPDTQPR